MLTDDQLRAIMPALPATRRGELLPFLQAAMTEFGIDRPAREAAFVAQLAHESGQFRFMEEIWGPTAAQRRYEPQSDLAARLGNTEAGDGRRFKGRGPIQITGRDNYRRFGGLLGVDLVSQPERAAVPDLAFRIAALFWTKKGLNELADRATPEAFREMTRRINGGFNGLADRQRFYAAARAALGVEDAPATRGPARGPLGPLPEEPSFERGQEAIRALARRRPRKPAARKRTTRKPAARTQARRKRKPRRAKNARRTAKRRRR
jgi:putative chitinase